MAMSKQEPIKMTYNIRCVSPDKVSGCAYQNILLISNNTDIDQTSRSGNISAFVSLHIIRHFNKNSQALRDLLAH